MPNGTKGSTTSQILAERDKALTTDRPRNTLLAADYSNPPTEAKTGLDGPALPVATIPEVNSPRELDATSNLLGVTADDPDASEEQERLTVEIRTLWAQNSALEKSLARLKTKETPLKADVAKARIQLGARLSDYKDRYARPGRGGQWTAWLAANKFARATADRLVDKYKKAVSESKTIASPDTHEAIVSGEEEVASYVRKLMPKLKTLLRTVELCGHFHAEVSRQMSLLHP